MYEETCTRKFLVALFVIAKVKEQSKCPFMGEL